jgi:hypothetical protein
MTSSLRGQHVCHRCCDASHAQIPLHDRCASSRSCSS